MSINDTIARIGKDYNIPIIQVVEGDEHCLANGLDAYLNRSYVCGSIYLGIYEDDDKKLISLLHEIGHFVDATPYYEDYLNYNYEQNAWEVAFILAPKYGLVVTDELRKWCDEQLETYYGWELNEMTGLGKERCAQTLRDFNGDWRKAKEHLLNHLKSMEQTITISLNDIKKDLYRSKANAKFSHYCAGSLYYVIELTTGEKFQFPIKTTETNTKNVVDLVLNSDKISKDEMDMLTSVLDGLTYDEMSLSSDLATTPFNDEIKASELIRWITKSFDSGDLVKIN